VTVGEAAGRLLAAQSTFVDHPALGMIMLEREFFLDYGKKATEDLPPPDAQPAGDLLLEALWRFHESASERTETRDTPGEGGTD
jgi:hypothetical protein